MKDKLISNKDVVEDDDISIHPFTWFSISSKASACIARAECTLELPLWNWDSEKENHPRSHFSNLAGYVRRTEKEIEFLTKKIKLDTEQTSNSWHTHIEFSDKKNNVIDGIGVPFLNNAISFNPDKIDSKTHEVLSNYQVFLKRELLFVHLLDLFEDSEKGERWLHEPNGALDNKKPIDFTNDLEGIEKVDKILGRIEHGIFS